MTDFLFQTRLDTANLFQIGIDREFFHIRVIGNPKQIRPAAYLAVFHVTLDSPG